MHSDARVPKWRQVYDNMRDRINTERWPAGYTLPANKELCALFDTSRYVVRRALSLLVEQELVVAGQGAPARVATHRVVLPVSHRTRFTASVDRLGRQAETALLSIRLRTPSVRIAKLLDMQRIRPVRVAEILRSVDGRPVCLTRHYFSTGLVPDISMALHKKTSVTAALRDIGILDYVRERTLVESRAPTAHEALLLGITRGNHVLCTIGRNVRTDFSPLEVSESVFQSENVTLEFLPLLGSG